MRKTLLICCFFLSFLVAGGTTAQTDATGYTANLSWDIPTTRADDTPLSATDLIGYEIYYTTDDPAVSGTITVAGGNTNSYAATNLQAGTYYFTISAVDSTGQKSEMSNLATITFGPPAE
jgi:predicted phage tail protein